MKGFKEIDLSPSGLLETLFQTNPDPIYLKNEKGEHIAVSESYLDKLGVEKDKVIGEKFLDLFSEEQGNPVEKDKLIELEENALEEEKIIEDEELQIQWPDSGIGWVEATIVPCYNEEDCPVGVLGVLRDVEECKSMEEELRESEKRYQKTIDNANIGVGVYGEDKRIKVLNQRMIEIIGYDKEDAPTLGQWFKKLYPDHHKRMEISRLWFEQIAKEGQIRSIETEIKTKDGEDRTLLFNAVQLSTGSVIFFADDITELVEARTKLEKRKDELEQKNKELEAFVYTVSHDLRTPLISLEGFSDMLRDEFADVLGEQGIHYLERIEDNIDKMDNFIDDLLELSRVGRKEVPQTDVKLREVVEEILDDLCSRIEDRGVKVEVQDDLPVIRFERKRLYQIYSNLISNACKYIGDQEEPKVEIGYEDQGDSWLLWCKDNGIGIEEENQDKIFEIFHREKRADEKGTGVGLAIVKRIVENHGGDIWIDSEKGRGTTFHIELPKR